MKNENLVKQNNNIIQNENKLLISKGYPMIFILNYIKVQILL